MKLPWKKVCAPGSIYHILSSLSPGYQMLLPYQIGQAAGLSKASFNRPSSGWLVK